MSKLPHVGTTIFTVMSALAQKHGAINLSQGFPDFPIDDALKNALLRAAENGPHQYQPLAGSMKLREKTAELIQESYGRKTDPETELLITAGATQAIYTTITALVSAGQEVLILDPAYDCYEAPVLLSGAKPVHVSLGTDFLPDWQRISDACNELTRMIIVNNPHNPSGTVWSERDVRELERLLDKYPRLLVLSDEVYEFITFDKPHQSVNCYPSIHERAIVISSFGKTFHITGWKIGYAVAPVRLMHEIKKVHQYLVFCVNSVAQQALADYMSPEVVSGLGPFYKKKRDLFRDALADSRFTLLPCEGTYFQLLDYKNISDSRDTDFCTELVENYGVAAIPLSVFNADGEDRGIIRLCFAKKEETLLNASKRLCRI